MIRKQNLLALTPWLLGSAMVALVIIAWGSNLGWELSTLTTYTYFPVLGLVAYSLMLSHYFVSELRRLKLPIPESKQYFQITERTVLFFILLHPGLLAWQLWRDKAGLPTGSYFLYVGMAARYAVIFGLVALTTFLLYETKRWWKEKTWWKYIVYANHLGMLLILWHSLRIGFDLQVGWLRPVWYVYGVALVVSITHSVLQSFRKKPIEIAIPIHTNKSKRSKK